MSQTLRRRVGMMVGAAALTVSASFATIGTAHAAPSLGTLKVTSSGLATKTSGTTSDPLEVRSSAACPANTGTLLLRINGGAWNQLPLGYGILTGSSSADAATGGGAHLPLVPTDRSLKDIAIDNNVEWAAGTFTLTLVCRDDTTFGETGQFTGTLRFIDSTHWTTSTTTVVPAIKVRIAPTLTGIFKVGHRVALKPGTFTVKYVKVTYRWTRDGKGITGATKLTYTLTKADKGRKITCVVTASKTGYKSVKVAPRAKVALA